MKFYRTNLALALHRLLHVLVTVLIAGVCMTSSAFAQPVEAVKQGTDAVETNPSASDENRTIATDVQFTEEPPPLSFGPNSLTNRMTATTAETMFDISAARRIRAS